MAKSLRPSTEAIPRRLNGPPSEGTDRRIPRKSFDLAVDGSLFQSNAQGDDFPSPPPSRAISRGLLPLSPSTHTRANTPSFGDNSRPFSRAGPSRPRTVDPLTAGVLAGSPPSRSRDRERSPSPPDAMRFFLEQHKELVDELRAGRSFDVEDETRWESVTRQQREVLRDYFRRRLDQQKARLAGMLKSKTFFNSAVALPQMRRWMRTRGKMIKKEIRRDEFLKMKQMFGALDADGSGSGQCHCQ
jgi:hypothetical protein